MPTQRSRHTPGQWEVWSVSAKQTHITGPYFIECDGEVIAEGLDLEDAKQIAREHNSHAALLEALHRLCSASGEANALQHAGLKVPAKVWAEMYDANAQARAAIAAATEGE